VCIMGTRCKNDERNGSCVTCSGCVGKQLVRDPRAIYRHKYSTYSHNEQDGKRPKVQGGAKDVVPFEKSIKKSVYVTGVNQ
jgi:hypothetical protein